MDEKVYRYRNKCRKCIYCKHCKGIKDSVDYWCNAKEKIINGCCPDMGRVPRPFCSCYEIREGKVMKVILFDYYFEAPDELNEFCKNIGYDNPDYSNFDLMFDSRVVEFCEQRLSPLWNEKVYKGKDNYKFKCGFAGAGYIRDIDTTRKWRLKYNNVDAPIVSYVEVIVNDYGYVSCKEQKY